MNPAEEEDNNTTADQHILTVETDPRILHYHEDIRSFLHQKSDTRRLTVGNVKKYVEAFVINDKTRFVLFGGQPTDRPALAAHATGVMNDVNAVYYRGTSRADSSHSSSPDILKANVQEN